MMGIIWDARLSFARLHGLRVGDVKLGRSALVVDGAAYALSPLTAASLAEWIKRQKALAGRLPETLRHDRLWVTHQVTITRDGGGKNAGVIKKPAGSPIQADGLRNWYRSIVHETNARHESSTGWRRIDVDLGLFYGAAREAAV
ncbi:hypothetical protein ACODT5_28890 [Streptomyces sp. 5.8]|uniref:hypothetical protein n=1 Tax=Streptomyces sp. 5.8 TaxID=3406571 RepID=UPI003BB4C90B